MLNEFSFLAASWYSGCSVADVSLRLADVPCGPLYDSDVTPRAALASAVEGWLAGR